MKKVFLCLAMTMTLAGCVATNTNYVRHESTQSNEVINYNPVITSSVNVLQKKYPPAKSALRIKTTKDAISDDLIASLRSSGYAIYEINERSNYQGNEKTKASILESAKSLIYVFDFLDKENSLYQMTIYVDEMRLATVFSKRNGAFQQVAPWSVF